MRIILESITVESTNGLPVACRWRSTTFRIRQIVDTWTWCGQWWIGGAQRTYFLLDCEEGMLEVFTDGQTWTLSRVSD